MLTQAVIEKFYKDVEALGLKHPVAEITKRTGMSKGQISQVLNKKLPPSEQLINKFNESFKIVHGQPIAGGYLDAAEVKITLQDYINLLHRENDRLFSIINSTLGKIYDAQQTAIAYHKAWVDHDAERESGGNPKKKKELMYKMGKLVDGIRQGDASTDIPGETHS